MGSGTGLLLLHGAGGAVKNDYPFHAELAADFRVVAPDLGVGDSDLPLTPQSLAARAVQACEDAGLEGWVVSGYSMGSMVAAAVAAAEPNRTRGVILSAGFARPDGSMRSAIAVWQHLLNSPPVILGRFLMSMAYSPSALGRLSAEQVEQLAVDIASGASESASAHLDLILASDVTVAVAESRQPMLIVTPARDTIVGPQHSDALASLRPDAQRIELDAGHALGAEAGDRWYCAISQFTRSVMMVP